MKKGMAIQGTGASRMTAKSSLEDRTGERAVVGMRRKRQEKP